VPTQAKDVLARFLKAHPPLKKLQKRKGKTNVTSSAARLSTHVRNWLPRQKASRTPLRIVREVWGRRKKEITPLGQLAEEKSHRAYHHGAERGRKPMALELRRTNRPHRERKVGKEGARLPHCEESGHDRGCTGAITGERALVNPMCKKGWEKKVNARRLQGVPNGFLQIKAPRASKRDRQGLSRQGNRRGLKHS